MKPSKENGMTMGGWSSGTDAKIRELLGVSERQFLQQGYDLDLFDACRFHWDHPHSEVRKMTADNNERPADLLFWFKDGACSKYEARVKADVGVSIGRTDSKRALGFQIFKGKKMVADFVLNRDQVAELATYLQHCALGRLRKPLGRKKTQVSLVALNSPKHRLHMELESAASDVHPGYHDDGEGMVEIEKGAPEGARLVAWFKKTHPQKAARIEKAFTKELWGEG
jgi:hypothetical protein